MPVTSGEIASRIWSERGPTKDLFSGVPPWVAWCEFVPLGAILTLALLQPGATTSPLVRALAAIAVLVPWLLEALGVHLPRLLFAALAMAAIIVLGHHHSAGAAWFLLAYLVVKVPIYFYR